MKLLFIRHGETNYNVLKKFYGTTDVAINQTGRLQCQIVHDKVANVGVEDVYVSSRKRTHQSASLIFPKHRYQETDFLDEWGFGEWEGLDADEIQAKFPLEWGKWLESPFGYTPPGSEPYAEHENRIISGFQELVESEKDDRTVALVTHLGTIRVILHSIFPDRDFWDINLKQGNYTCIDYTEGHYFVEIWNQ